VTKNPGRLVICGAAAESGEGARCGSWRVLRKANIGHRFEIGSQLCLLPANQPLKIKKRYIEDEECQLSKIYATMPAPTPLPNYLYKILPSAPPSTLPSRLPLSDLDRKDGYIHLSTSDQVASTADKWFDTFTELWLLKIRYDVLAKGTDGDGEVHADKNAEIKWEEVGRGCFAHFYNGDLGSGNITEVLKVEKTGTWANSLSLEA
jgi:uncharacterized protein (DUF952 family)